jgi:hypothetical protein
MIKIIHLDIYRRSVVFAFGETSSAIAKKLKCKIKKDVINFIDEFNDNIGNVGLCIDLEKGFPDKIILMKKLPENIEEFGILCHEIHHVCKFICEDAGIKCAEAEAYMFEFLYTNIIREM